MDNLVAQNTEWRQIKQNKNTTQKKKKMNNTERTKNKTHGWTHVLAKSK